MSKHRYRLISAIGIVVAIALMGVGIVSMTRQGTEVFSGSDAGKAVASDTLEVSSARILEIEGAWDVTITNGKPAVQLKASEKQLKNISFNQSGDRITLRQNGPDLNLGNLGHAVRVEVAMPDIQEVRLSGAGSLNINDLKAKDLKLTVQGGCSVKTEGTTIENLVLRSEGACNVDMADASITNAEVSLQGASNATINMAGGTLAGQIEGVGHLAYSGSVSSENVRTEGLAKVERK